MQISHLDHWVLTVADIDATVAFYSEILGMTPVTFGEGRHALSFGNQKINLHLLGRNLNPKLAQFRPEVQTCALSLTRRLIWLLSPCNSMVLRLKKVRSPVLVLSGLFARCMCAIRMET